MHRLSLHNPAALAAGLLLAAATIGCTTVSVKKNPGPHNHGIRYWRPKPYLFIGPYGGPQATPAAAPALAGGKGGGAATPSDGSGQGVVQIQDNIVKISMEIKYLPDYNEEYAIRLRPGIGTGSLSLNLQDGWNLTSVNMQTDQKLPELLTAISTLLPKAPGTTGGSTGKGGGGTGGGGDDSLIVVDARPDVPLGFYEPVIACDSSGRKSLFGWRYVGFMPFSGCPVSPVPEEKVVTCSENDMYGIVATANSIKFAKLSEIQNPTDSRNWPYRYKKTDRPGFDNGIAPPPQPTNPGADTTPSGAVLSQTAMDAVLSNQGLELTTANRKKVLPQSEEVKAPIETLVQAGDKLFSCVLDPNKLFYVVIRGSQSFVYEKGSQSYNSIEKGLKKQ